MRHEPSKGSSIHDKAPFLFIDSAGRNTSILLSAGFGFFISTIVEKSDTLIHCFKSVSSSKGAYACAYGEIGPNWKGTKQFIQH